MNKSRVVILLSAAAALGACASTKSSEPDVVEQLSASSKVAQTTNVAELNCDELTAMHLGITGQVTQADVKVTSVDFTDPTQLRNADLKNLKAGQMMTSVTKTAFLNSVPGAKLIPMLTGSAKKSAARADAVEAGNTSLAYLEGAMAAKSCPLPVREKAEEEVGSSDKLKTDAEAKVDETSNSLTDQATESLDNVTPTETSAVQTLGVRDLKAQYDDAKEVVDEVENAIDEAEDLKNTLDDDETEDKNNNDGS